MPREAPLYLAAVVPGLEEIAAEEIRARLDRTAVTRTVKRFDERTSLLVLRYPGPAEELPRLRTVEDVFALAAQREGIPGSRVGLAAIRAALTDERLLERAVSRALETRPRRRGKVTFRVIARKAGKHAFRRVDMQRAVERALQERFSAWRLVEDDATLEVWTHLVGDLLLVGVRLSDNTMRQRTGRPATLPAALKPTIAHAMVLLSQPRPEDVFLDPMCGTGTILLERAQAGRYRLLLGGDISAEAVTATRENVGPRYQPIEIRRWDGRRLPLEDGAVSAIAVNLPFGKQIGTPEENRTLYPALLDEWSRVLAAGGRMVLLTGDEPRLRRALSRHPELSTRRQVPVLVRGVPATIFSLRKPPASAARSW